MIESDNSLLREAVARFADPKKLEQAVSDLQSHGFNRADISFIARAGTGVSGELAKDYADTRQAEDDPHAPQEAAIDSSDVRQGRTLATSMAAVIASFAAAGFTVATGGGAAIAAGAAVAAGVGIGAVGAALGWKAGDSEHKFFDEQLERGGVLLWVRTPDAAAEERALTVLCACDGYDAHIRAVPATG
jgi:hypothetical protein